MKQTPEITELLKTKSDLQNKIKDITNRLTFSQSEPLREHLVELIEQDMQLSCKLTDHLVQ